VERFDVHAGLDERRFPDGHDGFGKNRNRTTTQKGGEQEDTVQALGKTGSTTQIAGNKYQIDVHV
jgi:hypothetical protein